MYFICTHMYARTWQVHMRRSENKVGLGKWTQVVNLGDKILYPLGHHAHPSSVYNSLNEAKKKQWAKSSCRTDYLPAGKHLGANHTQLCTQVQTEQRLTGRGAFLCLWKQLHSTSAFYSNHAIISQSWVYPISTLLSTTFWDVHQPCCLSQPRPHPGIWAAI